MFDGNPKASYFMTETMIVQKIAHILASLCDGKWLAYLFSVLRKISYKLKKMGKMQNVFFITLFAQKKPERGSFEVSLCLKQSLHKPRKINETMNHMGSQS